MKCTLLTNQSIHCSKPIFCWNPKMSSKIKAKTNLKETCWTVLNPAIASQAPHLLSHFDKKSTKLLRKIRKQVSYQFCLPRAIGANWLHKIHQQCHCKLHQDPFNHCTRSSDPHAPIPHKVWTYLQTEQSGHKLYFLHLTYLSNLGLYICPHCTTPDRLYLKPSYVTNHMHTRQAPALCTELNIHNISSTYTARNILRTLPLSLPHFKHCYGLVNYLIQHNTNPSDISPCYHMDQSGIHTHQFNKYMYNTPIQNGCPVL